MKATDVANAKLSERKQFLGHGKMISYIDTDDEVGVRIDRLPPPTQDELSSKQVCRLLHITHTNNLFSPKNNWQEVRRYRNGKLLTNVTAGRGIRWSKDDITAIMMINAIYAKGGGYRLKQVCRIFSLLRHKEFTDVLEIMKL
jgi:hypothetical protein